VINHPAVQAFYERIKRGTMLRHLSSFYLGGVKNEKQFFALIV
jgi:hypothetical protein